MKSFEGYETADGKLFNDERSALAHETDLIGEELDGLIMHVLKLDIPRHHQRRALLTAIAEKNDLRKCINRLYFLLNHGDD